jgi:hypothetical protein
VDPSVGIIWAITVEPPTLNQVIAGIRAVAMEPPTLNRAVIMELQNRAITMELSHRCGNTHPPPHCHAKPKHRQDPGVAFFNGETRSATTWQR